MAAYLLVMLAALHVVDVARNIDRQDALAGALALLAVLLAQAAIGILTLIEQVPMSLGILHQFMAVVVLTVAVVHAERLTSGAPASLHRRPDKAERTRA
jgi:cytochrome c oxidase assembly protein subunit 15